MNGDLFLEKDWTCIQTFIQSHNRDASSFFSIGDRPLNRSRSPIFRQQRGMHVESAKARQIKHPHGDKPAVGHHHDGVWLNLF
jgi:hypothetical protein